MSTITQAVAKREESKGFWSGLAPQLARALPQHLNAERLVRVALTEIRRQPKLADKLAAGNKRTEASLAGALLTCAQLGLEPGGPAGEAYLVLYGDEVTLIVGYQGYAKLFWQSPLAKHLDAHEVRERDAFDYAYGLHPFLTHKPAIGDRGAVVAFYAVGATTSGGSAFVVLSPEDVKKLRTGSKRSGNIADPMLWMERKTALRQLFKLLPKSPLLVAAMAQDEQVRTDLTGDVVDMPAPAIEAAPDTDDVDTVTGELLPPADVVDPATVPGSGWEPRDGD